MMRQFYDAEDTCMGQNDSTIVKQTATNAFESSNQKRFGSFFSPRPSPNVLREF